MRYVMIKVRGLTGDCTVGPPDAIPGPFHDTGLGVLATSWNFCITDVPDDVPNHRVRALFDHLVRYDPGLLDEGRSRFQLGFEELTSGERVGP